VQIVDSEDFLAAGVALFAAEGLQRGEAVLLTGTEAHLRAVRRAIVQKNVDYDAAIRRGQVSAYDVKRSVEAVLSGGVPDAASFDAVAGAALARAKAGYSAARWWGESGNFLNVQGNAKAALALEQLGATLARKHGVPILCSLFCDRFDPSGYHGILKEVCCTHTHVIPAEDYVRHRLAVNRAIAEIVGEIKGPLLQSLLSWNGLSCDLPSSQALLFWVQETLPEQFQLVLARAKAYA